MFTQRLLWKLVEQYEQVKPFDYAKFILIILADDTKPSYSLGFRKLCSAINCACFLYTDMTEHDDIVKVIRENGCEYTLEKQAWWGMETKLFAERIKQENSRFV